jgi:hypothetical protein
MRLPALSSLWGEGGKYTKIPQQQGSQKIGIIKGSQPAGSFTTMEIDNPATEDFACEIFLLFCFPFFLRMKEVAAAARTTKSADS